jgi:hypothetical protein
VLSPLSLVVGRRVLDVVVSLEEVSVLDVVVVSPGLMSVVTGGLVLVIVSVLVVDVVDVVLRLEPLGSG